MRRVSLGVALLIVFWFAAGAAPAEVDFDCLGGSADCPEILIEGDPHFELPGVGLSPFRGYGDPSIRKSPGGDRLWMTYSYLTVEFADRDQQPQTSVSIHLASSDDDGVTWRFRKRLWSTGQEMDPTLRAGLGLSVHEVSTLAPAATGPGSRWYALHLRYFKPFGPEERRPESFHFRLRRARRPMRLGRGPQARIGGPITDPAWKPDIDLSKLDPELSACAAWTEPSLFGEAGRLYLVAQCLVLEPETADRDPDSEFIGVFVSDGDGPIRALDWRWLGRLTSSRDARRLGGHVLTQAEVTTARDGTRLLLVTPKNLEPEEHHLGCLALELESLDPPRLRRRSSGRPLVRVRLDSSDSTGLGPGLCSYAPTSSTGILMVRTEVDPVTPEIVFRLHATGIHP